MTGLPQDPIFDAVGIVTWAVHVGIYDFRSAQRNWRIEPHLRGGDVGFRVARDL